MLHKPRIDYEHNTVDRDRRLCDVCRKHDLARALWRGFEDLRLHITGQVGIDRTNDKLLDLVTQCSSRFLQVLLCSFNLVLTL